MTRLSPLPQRIAAADLAPGLQYFGRSIHGTMDMNNDGSVDLAVGSLGAAVLLWCVFHLRLHSHIYYKTASSFTHSVAPQVEECSPDIYHCQV